MGSSFDKNAISSRASEVDRRRKRLRPVYSIALINTFASATTRLPNDSRDPSIKRTESRYSVLDPRDVFNA